MRKHLMGEWNEVKLFFVFCHANTLQLTDSLFDDNSKLCPDAWERNLLEEKSLKHPSELIKRTNPY